MWPVQVKSGVPDCILKCPLTWPRFVLDQLLLITASQTHSYHLALNGASVQLIQSHHSCHPAVGGERVEQGVNHMERTTHCYLY